MTLNMQQSEIA